jgi:hypothetical protein
MKKYSEFLGESKENDHFFHTSHQDKPLDGKIKDREFNQPVTWFFAQRHDPHEKYSAAREAVAIHKHGVEDREKPAINVYRPKHRLNLASEDQVKDAAKATGHPHANKAYEALDHRITGETEHTHKLINHLKDQGFHGAEHSDYSQVNQQENRKSIGLFHPHEDLHHVETNPMNNFHREQSFWKKHGSDKDKKREGVE